MYKQLKRIHPVIVHQIIPFNYIIDDIANIREGGFVYFSSKEIKNLVVKKSIQFKCDSCSAVLFHQYPYYCLLSQIVSKSDRTMSRHF